MLVAEAARPFTARPDDAAVVTDFDGTLSPIVQDPSAAGPIPGAVDALHRLALHYATVAVVSGRPVAFLRDRLELDHRPPGGLVVSGLYGLERLEGGTVVVHPAAVAWRDAVERTADEAEAAAPAGVGVERKGLSVTLHVRTAPHELGWAEAWAARSAAATGLVVHAGRMSLELRPPVSIDKGTVVADLVRGRRAACFLGDDHGDLPAFDALDALATDTGAAVVKVAVRSPEAPAELMARADLLVDGPLGALAFLLALMPDPPG